MHHAHTMYQDTVAQGSSRNQYGHVYHNYNASVYQQANPSIATRSPEELGMHPRPVAELLEKLAFESMDERHATISTAHARTCQWLFESEEYQRWRDTEERQEHHGFLWIKAKPGAGKSTLMKCACAHGIRSFQDETTLAFFFNARGDVLQRSASGLYRSLLYQLLDQFPQLLSKFHALPSRRRQLQRMSWPIQLLQDLVWDSVDALKTFRLTLYIDALDECPDDEMRELLEYLEDLTDYTVENDISLSILLSSRHYPHISVNHHQSLMLDINEGHHRDIEMYISSKLQIANEKVARNIRNEIYRRSDGVFLWIVLVISMLNQVSARGQVHLLERRLRGLPSGLHELYDDIVRRASNEDPSVLLMLQWIMYARRPLKLEECYLAVGLNLSDDAFEAWNPAETTPDDMLKFMIDASRGLANMSRGEVPTVQFIHESVRDYLIQDGLERLDPGLKPDLYVACNIPLQRCCQRYVLLCASRELHSPSDGTIECLPTSPLQVQTRRERMEKDYPLLAYSLDGLLYHAELGPAARARIDLVKCFQLDTWLRLHNLMTQDPSDYLGSDVSWEYVFAIKGHLDLLDVATRDEASRHLWDRKMPNERHTSLLAAAISRRDEDMIKMLRDRGATEDAVKRASAGSSDSGR